MFENISLYGLVLDSKQSNASSVEKIPFASKLIFTDVDDLVFGCENRQKKRFSTTRKSVRKLKNSKNKTKKE